MLRNKSFYFRAKFGAIYSASETKEYVLKNIPIDNRIWFKKWWLVLTQGNILFEIPKQCHS